MNYPSLLNILLVILIPLGGSVLTDIVSEVLKFLQSNNDVISKGAAVITIVGVLVQFLVGILERRREIKEKPIKITAEIDGKLISISANDLEGANKLASRFQKLHPEVAQKVTSASKIKVRATMPKRRKKKKRHN